MDRYSGMPLGSDIPCPATIGRRWIPCDSKMLTVGTMDTLLFHLINPPRQSIIQDQCQSQRVTVRIGRRRKAEECPEVIDCCLAEKNGGFDTFFTQVFF
jgi:hypothetical protein